MPADRLDLSASLAGQVSVKPEEHPDERSARLRTEARQALIEDCKGVAVFVVLLLAVIAAGAIAPMKGFGMPARRRIQGAGARRCCPRS